MHLVIIMLVTHTVVIREAAVAVMLT